MENRRKDLPADADANKKNKDTQMDQQEEFDDRSKDVEAQNVKAEEAARQQAYKDSQPDHEKGMDPAHKKQNEKWDRVNRKLPNLKK